jgi:hypothetical protein
MLENDVVGISALSVLANVALDVVVGHAELEIETGCDVIDARVGTALCVDLSVEDFAGADFGHHVA